MLKGPAKGTTTERPDRSGPRRRWLRTLPLIGAIVLAVILVNSLNLRLRQVPAGMLGQPVPAFDLPPVPGRALGLSDADLRGRVSVVNVFASWCLECRKEHGVLSRLAFDNDLPVHGLNYKDRPEAAAEWLDDHGDPYNRTGVDHGGRVGAKLGIYGVPETFVIDADGRIIHRHIGALSPRAVEAEILPLIRRLRETGS
ncbi:MAG: DsbE family thiol:disulfide interchange protein [Alphaproteobacteria bacterium]|nr:DsbE family thiol:disulfide interchange protein [Alphaproteobacteria bacterium]MDP6812179.1 DsbE family thiol:disulfide interchange protein [Alphaproteobacteria bacterium]